MAVYEALGASPACPLRLFCPASTITSSHFPSAASYFLFSALYGDRIFEKNEINRERTGKYKKTRRLGGKWGCFMRDESMRKAWVIK